MMILVYPAGDFHGNDSMMAMAIVAPHSDLNVLNTFLYILYTFLSYFVYLLLHTDLTQYCIICSKGC